MANMYTNRIVPPSQGTINTLTPEMQERLLTAQINNLHRQLTGYLKTNSENKIADIVGKFVDLQSSLPSKCKQLHMRQLFHYNVQDEQGLLKLQTCFNIVSKYGLNLLKPNKPPQWRDLAFTNSMFLEKVFSIQGAKDILHKIGYSVVSQEGISFPRNKDPDREEVSRITADLLIACKELEAYINRQHTYPLSIDEILPLHLRIGQYPRSKDSNASYDHGLPPGHVAQPREMFPRRLEMDKKISVPDMRGDHALARDREDIVNPILPSVPGISSTLDPDDPDEFHDAMEELDETKVCDICGSKPPKLSCPTCDGKLLCGDCDMTWHNHPRRKSHLRETFSAVSSSPTSSSVGTGAKPKVQFSPSLCKDKVVKRQCQETSQHILTKRQQMLSDYSNTDPNNVPILSIFERDDTVKIPLKQPQMSPKSALHEEGSSDSSSTPDNLSGSFGSQLGATGPITRQVSLFSEIKAIVNKDERIGRIKRELANIDRLLDQYKQEINIIIKQDDTFEDNKEYDRLSKQKDRLNRDKMLIEEHWKELEKEKFENKQRKKLLDSENTENDDSQMEVKYPPKTTFDFEKDINFPNFPGKSKSFDEENSSDKTSPTYPSEMFDNKERYRHNLADLSGKKVTKDMSTIKTPCAWICHHCTYHNDMSTVKKVCSICGETSINPSLVYNQEEAEPLQVKPKVKPQISETPKKPPRKVNQSQAYKSAFVDVQDEIFREKKLAQEEYKKKLQGQGNFEEELSMEQTHPPLTRQTEKVVRDVPYIPDNHDLRSTTQNQGVREKHKAPSINSQKRKEGDVDMQTKLELLQEQRRQEEASIQAKEIIRILRKAETEGYNMREIELALDQTECVDPFKWLKENFKQHVESLKQLATEHLMLQGGKTVSTNEAKEALIDCCGDKDLALQMILSNRAKIVDDLTQMYNIEKEHILDLFQRNNCDKHQTEQALIGELFQGYLANLWPQVEEVDFTPNHPADHNTHLKLLEEKLKNKELDLEWRIRIVLCEFSHKVPNWGRAQSVVQVLEQVDPSITIEEVVEAVRQCGDRQNALNFLQQDCLICYSEFPANMILSTTACQCKVCRECMKDYFDTQIKERHIKNLCCPYCQEPDIENTDEYLTYLDNFLRQLLSQEVYKLFQDKVRDWHLMQDPNFRWCSTANCENGFIFNPDGNRIKMLCEKCKKYTCFKCKKPWEDQHQGISCEAFRKWKEENNPEYQEAGLAKHLQENGIDCPKCKMRYTLAKGGCMHFKCTQCGHEFCCGCNRPFMQGKACKELEGCKKAGLHCHHPRDCLYYLRDLDIEQLQELLRDNDVEFRVENQQQNERCEVMEQKELQTGLQDEPCGKEVAADHAGLCLLHYKEYLVSNINKNKIDPVSIMDVRDLTIQYTRRETQIPAKQNGESETQYKHRLANDIREKFPIERRIAVIV